MTKEKLFEAVKDLPENFELEDLFERLILIRRIEEGLRQSDNGETLTEAEAKNYLSRWLTDGAAAAPVARCCILLPALFTSWMSRPITRRNTHRCGLACW